MKAIRKWVVNGLPAAILTAALPFALSFSYAQNADQASDQRDLDLDNEYIQDLLDEHPPEEPIDLSRLNSTKRELAETKAELKKNDSEIIARKRTSSPTPEIVSLKDSGNGSETTSDLYKRLAEQTGMPVDEVQALFEANEVKETEAQNQD